MEEVLSYMIKTTEYSCPMEEVHDRTVGSPIPTEGGIIQEEYPYPAFFPLSSMAHRWSGMGGGTGSPPANFITASDFSRPTATQPVPPSPDYWFPPLPKLLELAPIHY